MTILRRLKRYLIAGFLVAGPLGISVFLLYWIVVSIDGLLSPLARALIGHQVPGLGLLSAFLLLIATGFLASNLGGRHLLDFFEEIFLRIPVFSGLYRTVKQMAAAFTPGAASHFRSVVLVEYPRPGVYSLGFVTNRVRLEEKEAAQAPAQALESVYVPTNNLYIGDIILVPADKLRGTNMSLQQGVQSILSAGTALPSSLPLPKPPPEPDAEK